RMEIADNENFEDIRPSGIKYSKLKEDGAEIIDVLPGREDADLVVVAENGQGLRFDTSELKPLTRNARGVIAKRGDSPLAGGALVKDGETLLLQGDSTCAAVRVDDIEPQGRGGKGRYIIKPTNGDALHTILASPTRPRASQGDALEKFDSKSKLGGHGSRQEIDYFVIDVSQNGETMELFNE
ncbi:MAG: DNA gyrase C-terminal beta-propeller domain-containing protein, partial [bacterium]